ncbi:NUDIX domain-containing protein [Candidatus Uhrbacteria bacterium]|nr:NUDIX domain-containing protein [Candidatus Uhrbacteria bacterium]
MSRYTFIAAVHLIIERDGEILLSRRCNTGYQDGVYDVPAGHIESGETPRIAAIREAKEEIGITLSVDDLQFVHIVSRFGTDRERFDFYFRVLRYHGGPYIAEPDKCSEISWFPKDTLPQEIVPHVRDALSTIFQGTTVYSEQDWDKS